jgi:hypothetical protein
MFAAVPLVMARLRESHGDTTGALAWVRRRPGAGSTQHVLLSTYLREEGRLAALAGDHVAAARGPGGTTSPSAPSRKLASRLR